MASWSMNENMLSQIFDTGKNLTSSMVNQSKKVGNIIKTAASSAGTKWKKSSPVTKACIIGSGTALLAPLAIIPAIGIVGFTSAGVAAGSLAASMQTATTVSGSVFALCQSAGAVGAVATSTSVGVGLAAGATAGGVTAAVCEKKRPSQNNDENGQAKAEEEEDAQGDCDESLSQPLCPALYQSAGAVGTVATSTSVGVGLAAGATAGGVTAAVCEKKRPSQNNDENGHAGAEEEEDA
ncbi:unnamed protein product [Didymodactylos carnosus]|uniref:Uncharacterized protein n=1 Tax=Didymodactylos carnosus TaxID=1234261 RepID=A0A8S2JBF6_9BILA|nr:unnamed protein product [Didymodactylos carnosus]CAF3792086.1 unnamed protein product [Didymodactylos carnosus]